jgi:hypothetical protein
MGLGRNRWFVALIFTVVATISITVFGRLVLSPFWFWVYWEVFASALVAIGCGGEWYLFINPAKEGHEAQHRRKEFQFITAVAIGVFMEFLALGHAIPEALRLEKQVEGLRKENFILEAKLEQLQRGKLPVNREISPQGSNTITAELAKMPILKVRIARTGPVTTSESLHLALSLVGIFEAGKADVDFKYDIRDWTGLKLIWKNIEPWDHKAKITETIFGETGQDFRMFDSFATVTNLDVDLFIIVGKRP